MPASYDQAIKSLADPGDVLASDRPSLWPLVPLMRSDESDLRKVAQRLGKIADDALRREFAFRFIVLGSLRYDKNLLIQLVEEQMITHEDMLEASGYYRFIWEKGIEKGMEEGVAKGMVTGVEEGVTKGEIRLLSRLLERRFGPLPSWAVDKIRTANPDTLEDWGVRIVDAPKSGLAELLV